jgi:hypothetical protein
LWLRRRWISWIDVVNSYIGAVIVAGSCLIIVVLWFVWIHRPYHYIVLKPYALI